MTLVWTGRDLDIVQTLTRRVTMLTIEQVIRIWWPSAGSLTVVHRRLRRLIAAGLVSSRIVNIHPPLAVTRPLVQWQPADDEPDFERVSELARIRWGQPAVPHEVFAATKLAANLFGSSAGRFPDLNHRDHDILLGQVYLLYRTTRPREAAYWIGEHALPKAGYRVKDADAFLVDHQGRFTRVIESAGHYTQAQVESFHEHCAEHDIPYELW